MGTQLTEFCSFVNSHHVVVIEVGESLKWIHSYQNIPSISLEEEFNPLEKLQEDE